tara:strand:+ start:951 stop:1970 length:1020 start_codon:yes stop_codon:yes gene_type:complete
MADKTGKIDFDIDAIFTFDDKSEGDDRVSHDFIKEKYDYEIKMFRQGKSIVIQAPTWKMRKQQSIEHYIDEFIKNPSNANRDFAANPIDAVSPAIEHRQYIDRIFEKNKDFKHPIIKNPYIQPNGDIKKTIFIPGYKCYNKSIARYAHVDIGLTRDRLGLAIGHAIDWKENEYRNVTGRMRKIKEPVMEFDLLASYKGYQNNPIQLNTIRQILLDMLDLGFNIRRVTLDGYQSADFIQSMNTFGIESKVLSIDKDSEPFDELVKAIYAGRIHLYPLLINTPEGKENLPHKELRQLERVNNKYDHPVGGSHDLIQAVAGVVMNIKQYAKIGGGGALGYLN